MVVVLRHVGALPEIEERLKMFVKTSARWSVQVCRTHSRTPSGSVAFLGLILCNNTPNVISFQDSSGWAGRGWRSISLASLYLLKWAKTMLQSGKDYCLL